MLSNALSGDVIPSQEALHQPPTKEHMVHVLLRVRHSCCSLQHFDSFIHITSKTLYLHTPGQLNIAVYFILSELLYSYLGNWMRVKPDVEVTMVTT